ncbi:uncharacterized protein LOC143287222 [Babylonia areolata]|uniref:uncharacterized protein LOC143287222 n=1 Tax=Babylonia areolata TaxID=304850 RepID=UPI003FD12128
MDWVMRRTTDQRQNGIQWTLWKQLEDLDFADDLALLSHSQQQMQKKTKHPCGILSMLGTAPITLDGEALEDVESFPYLGSIVNKQGGTDADVKVRIGKARAAFRQLKNMEIHQQN